ncbi:MAG: 4Fe-4S ferredoxin, partial [Planctomycetota bacterium]
MKSAQDQIREITAQLLSEGKTNLVIGFAEGSLPMRVTSCFITKPDDAQRLVWNSYCSNNLAVYLTRCFALNPRLKKQEPPPKIAIVVKGCDGRSTVGLIKEQQVPKENLLIIAVPCDGMLDADLTQQLIGQSQITSAEEHD